MKRKDGWSMIETMVVLAIIAVLMAIALPRYARAIRMAKDTAADEAKRQQYLARDNTGFMDNFHPFNCEYLPRDIQGDDFLRECARGAFRQTIDAGKFDIYVSELLFRVDSDAEFRAYWHTLMGPNESVPHVYTVDGKFVAIDEDGNEFVLEPIERAITPGDSRPYVVGWDFISTDLGDTAYGSIGTTALLSDGHKNEIKYPGVFPGTWVVAELSARFMDEVFNPRLAAQ